MVAYHYIEGYQPQAYNLTKTLSKNEAENVFTFVYEPVPEDTVTTETEVITRPDEDVPQNVVDLDDEDVPLDNKDLDRPGSTTNRIPIYATIAVVAVAALAAAGFVYVKRFKKK